MVLPRPILWLALIAMGAVWWVGFATIIHAFFTITEG